MLPRLIAEEQLRAATVHAIASGAIKGREARRILAKWEREARGHAVDQPKRKRTFDESAAALQAMGIQVVRVKTAGRPSTH